MSSLNLFLFGYPRIERHGIPVKLTTRKALACLAYLGTMPDRQSRNVLIALLWPTYSQSQGRTTLRHILYTLNSTLGRNWLATSRETIELNPERDIRIDVLDFRRLRSECQQHDHPADAVCHTCLPLLKQAVALYRDAFLAGFTLRDSAAFDDWQYLQSEQLQQELAESLERLVMGLSATEVFADAIPFAHRWLALDALQESAHCALMQLGIHLRRDTL